VPWQGICAFMLEMIRVALELVCAGLLDGFNAAHLLVNFYFLKLADVLLININLGGNIERKIILLN
jgi:hypothetical protein